MLAVIALASCGHPPASEPPLPRAAYAHYLDGRLAALRDDWPSAVDALRDAFAAAPDQPMLAVELARALHHAKRDNDAASVLASARTKWPGHAIVWITSGDLLAANSPKPARDAYSRAIELAPLEPRAYLGLAKLQPPAAELATLRRLVSRVPTSIEGHYRLGQRLALDHQVGGALPSFRRVLELDPDHIDARLDLARGLRLTGKLSEAIAQTRSAFDRAGQAIDVAEELFDLLVEADDRQAVIDLVTLLDDERSDADTLVAIARRERQLGRIDRARAVIARVAKSDDELAALATAELALATGDYARAASGGLAIATESKRFAAARRLAGNALLAAGQPQRALDAVAPARATAPKSSELALISGYALVDLGRRNEATAALDGLGDSESATLARARLADRAGEPTQALALAEQVIGRKPDHAAALNFAGFLLADRGERLADGERYLRRARELSPGDVAVLDSWGWLLFAKRDLKAAAAALDHAARYAPFEPEILIHLAAVRHASGDNATARQLLDRADTLHPTADLARRATTLRTKLAARP